ncbi:MAG: C25 family cysteine peptidase, partial [Bacteroidota bacterium]|nr:C25 family cysteine peptidase [Bacteroidota bacterium]
AFDTLVVNIDQLFDQFNYGEQSPRAVFQFMKFLASARLPQYLFLVGKGLNIDYRYYRSPQSFSFYRELVPTAGFPASDMAFTAGLGAAPGVPGVATGRLAANTPAEVAAYFNKVKERDALPFDNLNRKKILHLSGGIEENEPVLFRQILAEYQEVAEDLYLGGRVQAIAKRSTEIKLINIAGELNAGLGLITFFGHSAPNTLDFDIGRVTDPVMGYDNAGKYPFLLMNGCDAGSFFHNTAIPGENWTTTANKGAVGFIAHSSYGLVSGLQRYSSTFYNVAFGDSVFIKQGIGKVQQEVCRRYLENFGTSALGISQVQQMVLLGDPAVPIFGAHKPDYAPAEDGLYVSSLNGEPITALTESFRLQVPVSNFGMARPESMRINVKREFNEGQVIEYDTIVPTVLYADTISMLIRNTNTNGYGINRFTVHVDADNIINELNEENNIVSLDYFIPQNTTKNLFPYNYSIVRDRNVQLSFQYTDVLSGPRDYELQIDTTDTFDSGFRKEFVVHSAVLGRQSVTLLNEDSVAYYWRVRIREPLENESKDWSLSTFVFIDKGSEGWAQIHFPQYDMNGSAGLVKDPQLRRLRYQETVSDVAVRTFSSSSGKPQDSISFKVSGVEFNLLQEGGACRINTINLVAFDRRSTQPYAGLYFKWYESGRRLLCGREPYVINNFYPSELVTGQGDDLIQYVDNIANGDSVVLFNIGNAGYEQWPQAALDKLGELGISADQVAGLQDGDPVVIFARKGLAPGTARIFHGASPTDVVRVDKTVTGRFTSGAMSSKAIGPALRWDRFVPRVREVEDTDTYRFSLVGISPDGKADTLKTNISGEQDLSFIDASAYPELKVVFESEDDVNLTSVQLAHWLVLYEPVAEGMITYRGPTAQHFASEGEQVTRDFAFINISDKPFPDSLTVRFDVVNVVSGSSPSNMKIKGPAPGDTTAFTVPFSTLSKGGLNNIEVFVNPRISPEKVYDNNLVVLNQHLHVLTDQTRPVIDVTFDGRRLQQDDYVSSSPRIQIRLWDENPFLLKKDTADVRIFLAFPCDEEDCAFTRVYLERPDIAWSAATDTSDFTVRFAPRDLADGAYILRVEAADARGNPGGDDPYEIRFHVASGESVVVSAAYPNPFVFETN